MTTNIYSTVYPYPKIGADACDDCAERPVVADGASQDWTVTGPQPPFFTFALEDWSAIPNDNQTDVVVSKDQSVSWRVTFDDSGSRFTVELPNTGLFWTLSDTSTGSAVELHPSDGSANQVFSTSQPSN